MFKEQKDIHSLQDKLTMMIKIYSNITFSQVFFFNLINEIATLWI